MTTQRKKEIEKLRQSFNMEVIRQTITLGGQLVKFEINMFHYLQNQTTL